MIYTNPFKELNKTNTDIAGVFEQAVKPLSVWIFNFVKGLLIK